MTAESLPFCRECGYKLGDARFCPRCGTPRRTATTQAPVPTEPASSEMPPVPDEPTVTAVPHHHSGSDAYQRPQPTQPHGAERTAQIAADNRKLLSVAVGAFLLLLLIGVVASPFIDSDAGSGASARCDDVPSEVVDIPSTGLAVTGGGSVRSVKAVSSTDYQKVWFVSAELEGPGLEGNGDIGTWTTNSLDPAKPAGFLAVDSIANQFSNWTDGRKANPRFGMGDDGAEESRGCIGWLSAE